MATSNAKENLIIKDLNGNYLLFQVPAGSIAQSGANGSDWAFDNPVFIQRLTEKQYNQYFVTNTNTITIDKSNPSVGSGNGSTAVSEPWAVVVMATTLLSFALVKKMKAFFA